MLRKIILISLVIVGIVVLVSPDSFDFFSNIPNEAEKITKDLTDPQEDTLDTLQNNIQKAFGFVGEKIESLAFSADVFLSKQENNNKTSTSQDEEVFFGKLNGQKTAEPNTLTTGTSSGGGSQTNNNNGNTNPAHPPTIIQNPTNTPPITSEIPFDTLSLITKKQ